LEALLITVLSIALALLALWAGDSWIRDWLLSHFGLYLSESLLQPGMWSILLAIIGAAIIAALLPAINAYRQGLSLQLR
jgi:putative ABC transport system permease protein